MKPIVFLDIDGVLNTNDMPMGELLRRCINELNRITEATDCNYVLSSSWRYMVLNGAMTVAGFEYLLRTHGAKMFKLIGTTDDDGDTDNPTPRGELIERWLCDHGPYAPRRVVLDDADDGISERGHPFVQTCDKVGLTEADADKAIQILLKANSGRAATEGG